MSNRGDTLCFFGSLSQIAKGCISKWQNFGSTKRKSQDEVDRISSLPDDIIIHILSFLTTREAVSTSVLSTRWRSLWTSVTTLDFKDNWPCFNVTRFDHVIANVLSQHKANVIKRLSLSSFGRDCNSNFLTTFINTAITQNQLEELELFFFYHLEASFPSMVFTCQTISVLKLGWKINIKPTLSVDLPSLKILHISLLCITDSESLMRLFSGCPILEEFYYEELKFNDASSFKICVPSLKKLHIKNLGQRVLIETPSLEYLQLQETKITGDSLAAILPNLVEARLDLYFYQQEKYMPNFFYGISQVKYLCLSASTIEVLTFYGVEFPEFHNLVHLELSLSSFSSYFLIQLLLTKCPKLEVLEIEKVNEDENRKWTQPIPSVPDCFYSHLTVFKFREYGGSHEDLEFTRYILKNAKVLKTMTIQMAKWLEQSKIRSHKSKLCSLQRASEDCVTDYQVSNQHLPHLDVPNFNISPPTDRFYDN